MILALCSFLISLAVICVGQSQRELLDTITTALGIKRSDFMMLGMNLGLISKTTELEAAFSSRDITTLDTPTVKHILVEEVGLDKEKLDAELKKLDLSDDGIEKRMREAAAQHNINSMSLSEIKSLASGVVASHRLGGGGGGRGKVRAEAGTSAGSTKMKRILVQEVVIDKVKLEMEKKKNEEGAPAGSGSDSAGASASGSASADAESSAHGSGNGGSGDSGTGAGSNLRAIGLFSGFLAAFMLLL